MKAKYCLLAILVTSVFFVAAHKASTADNLVGRWKYTISDVPPEHESGEMVFELKEDKLTGYLEQASKKEMKELKTEQAKVSFKVDFEGGLIDFKLNQDGEKLTGTVLTNYGEFTVEAVRAAKN